MNDTKHRDVQASAAPQLVMEQFRLLHANLPSILLVNVLFAASLALILREVVPTPRLVAWLAFFGLVTLMRTVLYVFLGRARQVMPVRQRRDWLRTGVALSGLAWGLVPIALFPENQPLHQMALVFVAAGVSAAAASALIFDLVSILLFAVPVLAPLIVRLFQQGGEVSLAMGAMGVVYLGFIVGQAHRSRHGLFESVQWQHRSQTHEAALQESRDRMTMALEGAGLALWDYDIEHGTVYLSERWAAMLGLAPGATTISIEEYLDRIHPEDRPELRDLTIRVLKGIEPYYRTEHRVRVANGSWLWIQSHGKVTRRGADGRALRMTGTHADITEQRRRDDQARTQLRALEAEPTGILITDATLPDMPIIYANPAFERITGYRRQDVLGRNCRFLQGTDRHQSPLAEVRAAINLGRETRVVLRNYRKNGALFWNELTIAPVRDADGRLTHFIGIQQDVTERIAAEHALRESQTRLSFLLATSPVVIHTSQSDGELPLTFVSENVGSLFGYTPQDFTSDPGFWSRHVHRDDLAPTRTALQAVLERDYQAAEYRFLMADGQYRWIYDERRLVRGPDETVIEVIGSWVDIHARKIAEQGLRRSEANLAAAQAMAHVGNWSLDLRDDKLEWSDEVYRIYGYLPRSFVPRFRTDYLQVTHPEDRQKVLMAIDRILDTRELHAFDHRIVRPDGSERVVDVTAQALFTDARGNVVSLGGVVQDITERKQAELALAASAAHVHAILENTVDAIITISDEGIVESFNRAAEQIFGYPAEQILGQNISLLMPEPDRSAHDGYLERHRQGGPRKIIGIGREVTGRRRDGSLFPVDLAVSEMQAGGRRMYIGVLRDITQRKQAERELHEARSFLATVVDNLPAMLFVKEARELRFVAFNRAGEELIGIPREQLIGRNDYAFFPEDQADAFVQRDREVLESGERLEIPEEPVLSRTRGTRWLHTIKTAIPGQDGKPAYLLGISTDITESKRSEDNLRRAHAKNQGILDAIPDLLLQVDDDGRFVDYHAYNPNDLAVPPEHFMGKTVTEVLPEPLARRISEAMQDTRNNPSIRVLEYSLPDALGQDQDWEARVARITTGGFLFLIRNITSRKKVERLKNEFVSTVSHELRTPLTSIRGSLGLVAGGAAGTLPDRAQEMIEIAYRNTDRLSHLINDILDIERIESGRMQFNMEMHDALELVDQALAANRGYGEQHQVRLERTAATGSFRVRVDADRFMQVMANLLSNAVKFSPTGDSVSVQVSQHDQKVRIAVHDNGPGIPDEFRSRIFQKFSQADASDTRSKSGSGLGLSIARSIVERMGGELGYDSRPGRGTVFHLDLPRPDADGD